MIHAEGETYYLCCDNPRCSAHFTSNRFNNAVMQGHASKWVMKSDKGQWSHFCSESCQTKTAMLTARNGRAVAIGRAMKRHQILDEQQKGR